MIKKLKKEIKKMPNKFMVFTMIFALLFSYFATITNVLASSSTTTLSVSFRDDNANNGKVQYSLDDGAHWDDVDGNITNLNISVTGDNLRIKIVPNNNYSVDYAGIELYLDNIKVDNISSLGLDAETGYSVPSNVEVVSLVFVEFRKEEGTTNFDGRAVVLWSCGNGVCYHTFDNIPDFDDGNSTFYKDTDIEADNKLGTTFDVNADYIGWYLTDEFTEWQNLYEIATGNSVDWNTLDPELIIGDPNNNIGELETAAINAGVCTAPATESCINTYAANQGQIWTHKLQPVGEPSYNNAYVSYGDRNFKVVIYNSNYKGIAMGDLSSLHYYPAQWANAFVKRDQFDISSTTKNNPTVIDSILLESTVKIKALSYNSFEILSIEALDVPEDAVTITKDANGEYSLVFSSNFYDNVVFKVTDTNNDISYFQVKRYTIDAWIRFENDSPVLTSDFYFDNTKSYQDFILTAKIVYKDSTSRNVTLTAKYGIDDGLGNITNAYEINEEEPEFGPAGKGLKRSTFEVALEQGEDQIIQDIYLNVEYTGSTDYNYAGAYVGAGEGTLANIYHGEED